MNFLLYCAAAWAWLQTLLWQWWRAASLGACQRGLVLEAHAPWAPPAAKQKLYYALNLGGGRARVRDLLALNPGGAYTFTLSARPRYQFRVLARSAAPSRWELTLEEEVLFSGDFGGAFSYEEVLLCIAEDETERRLGLRAAN